MSRGKKVGIRIKKRRKNGFANFIVFIFVIVLLSSVTINCIYQMSIYNELVQVENKILNQIEEEKNKNINYKAQKDYYKSDAYIEKIAREKLGLIKSDEIIIINKAK